MNDFSPAKLAEFDQARAAAAQLVEAAIGIYRAVVADFGKTDADMQLIVYLLEQPHEMAAITAALAIAQLAASAGSGIDC